MVITQYEEILCPTALIAFYQRLRVPLFRLEQWQDILEAEL